MSGDKTPTGPDCNFDKIVYDPAHQCNKFLLRNEFRERNTNVNNENLYPTLNDPNFSLKIAAKQEFRETEYDGTIYDVEERANILSNMDFEISPHQVFVKNFLSLQTPYNSLLLFHGLGTGKTCSAIGICEEYRDYLRQSNLSTKIIIVASPNVQENFRLQLFNATLLKDVNGEWTINNCVGGKLINEVNPTHTKNISKEKIIQKVNKIINTYYDFVGYREFANYIERKQTANVDFKKWSTTEQLTRMRRNLKLEFDNRLICIDEVHNIRNSEDNENKRIANALTFLVKSASNMRLLFLSGTPMFNNYREIIWLINIMNMNDRRGLIKVGDVFDSNGEFRKMKKGEYESGKDVLIRKATGYVSFVRGENPYTFPYRIYPDVFSPENTFNVITVPKENVVGGRLIENRVDTVTKSNLFIIDIGEYQNMIYTGIMNSNDDANIDNVTDKNDKEDVGEGTNDVMHLSYTKLQEPIQCLNISFPINVSDIGDISIIDAIGRGNISAKQAIGNRGLQSVMNYIDDRSSDNMIKGEFEYKPWVQSSEHANFLNRDKIGKYSGKMKNVCDMIVKSKGVILIYSQFLDGALIPMALALESMGIMRYGDKKRSLFKTPPVQSVDYKTMEPIEKGNRSKDVSSARYIMITGDKRLSPNNVDEIIAATQDENKDGKIVKVILISMAGSEGVDLKFVRQVHILEPWYNLSRIEQTIGRAVRNNSHRLLPYSERNVQIFMYGTMLKNSVREAADVSVYRSAEYKAIQIGNVTRTLKEVSVDCFLNQSQANFTVDTINQTVRQVLSSGTVLEKYAIGDRSLTMMTDFMKEGAYKCSNTNNIDLLESIEINKITYDEKFIIVNSQKIISKIKELFKERYFYTREDLISKINYPKKYPDSQIYSALTSMTDSETEYLVDIYGRSGQLKNIGDYYLFQPIELINPEITVFERSTPIQYKHDKIKIRMEIPGVMKEELIRMQMPPPTNNKTKEDEADKDADNKEDNDIISNKKEMTKIGKTITTIDDMYKLFVITKTYYDNPKKLKPRDKLYHHVGVSLRKLKDNGIVENISDMSVDDVIDYLLISHLIDNLPIRDKISLFLDVYGNAIVTFEKDPTFLNNIRNYFNRTKHVVPSSIGKSFNAYLFFDPSVKSTIDNGIFYVKYDTQNESGSIWKLAEFEDRKDIEQYLEQTIRAEVKKTGIHTIFGFMSYGKTDVNIADYKLKDLTNNRSTGYKCNDIATKTKKAELLKNVILQSYDVQSEHAEDIDKLVNGLKSDASDFSMKEICILVEFITRYYEIILKAGKHWFFTYEQQVILQDMLKVT